MRCFVLLLVAAAAVGAPSPQGPPPDATPEAQACHEALKPPGDKEAKRAIKDTCIAEQAGLEDIIAALKPERPSGGDGPGGPGGRRPGGPGGRRGPGGPGGPGGIIKLLEEAGNTAEAEALKKCMARENGHLTADDTFDVAAFKEELQARVAGTDSEANTLIGLTECPEDALVNFDVRLYTRCVMAYCATGEAPPADETAP